MGCNSSAVIPLGETDDASIAGIKVRVNPSTPDTLNRSSANEDGSGSFTRKLNTPPLESMEPPVETLTKDFNTLEEDKNKMGAPPLPPLAFSVPAIEESIIKKHPPKKFRRLLTQQAENSKTLTHEELDAKLQEAENRRKEILNQRIQSALHKNNNQYRRLIYSDTFSQKFLFDVWPTPSEKALRRQANTALDFLEKGFEKTF